MADALIREKDSNVNEEEKEALKDLKNLSVPQDKRWGGYREMNPIVILLLIIMVHMLIPWYHVAYDEKIGIFSAMLVCVNNPARLLDHFVPPKPEHYVFIATFIIFEAILMLFIPTTPYNCAPTPEGNTVSFRCNALPAWFVTVAAYFGSQYFDIFGPTYVHDNFWDLSNVLLLYGNIFTIFFYYKGIYFPSNSDATFREIFSDDFFLGIELHPKIGNLNCKLFSIGRIGMNLWTLINLAHAQKEYATLGYLTWPMILANLFGAVYTVDWAWKEAWYINTIDMAHDRFGFMLITGPLAFIPTAFCCQTFYLSYNTRDISTPFAIAVILFFSVSYFMFRVCNDQKDFVRQTKGEKSMWGYKPKIIHAEYITADGKEHHTLLLCSHLWGLSRHFNYFVDWCMTFCYGLVCGFDSIIPHIYFIYMIILLIHRSKRDDRKCRIKYGKYWDEYCKNVPYKIVPYIY